MAVAPSLLAYGHATCQSSNMSGEFSRVWASLRAVRHQRHHGSSLATWRRGEARLATFIKSHDVRKEKAAQVSARPMHQWARGGGASAVVKHGMRILPIAKRFVQLNLFSAGTIEHLRGGATLNYDVTLNKPKLTTQAIARLMSCGQKPT